MRKLTIISHTLFLLSIVLIPLFFIWATVEYIIYEIKDSTYNPISLYLLIISLILFITTFISSYMLANKYEDILIDKYLSDEEKKED